jgi:hypothetical protein
MKNNFYKKKAFFQVKQQDNCVVLITILIIAINTFNNAKSNT